MRDLDSAVGRLDNILITVYFIVVILIFAVALVSVCWRRDVFLPLRTDRAHRKRKWLRWSLAPER